MVQREIVEANGKASVVDAKRPWGGLSRMTWGKAWNGRGRGCGAAVHGDVSRQHCHGCFVVHLPPSTSVGESVTFQYLF